MGCGGSKEEKKASTGSSTTAAAAADDKPAPMRKVRTNFSDINYAEPASGRRETVYAPSEIPESRRPTEARSDSTGAPPVPSVSADGMLSPATRTKSWIERYKAKRSDTAMSDEDMKKWIGMDRKELAVWAKDKPVGKNQPAYDHGLDGGGDGG